MDKIQYSHNLESVHNHSKATHENSQLVCWAIQYCVTVPLKSTTMQIIATIPTTISNHTQNHVEEGCCGYTVYRTSGCTDMKTVLPGILQVLHYSHTTLTTAFLFVVLGMAANQQSGHHLVKCYDQNHHAVKQHKIACMLYRHAFVHW